ncbi:MAG TPA: hemolysin family protein [Nitrospira sp.]|jgi:putative hemolysin|nr:hemolysin family protein [Nitrospira sp.]
MSEIAIVFLCLMFNALIAGAEMAFVAVSRPSLRELIRQGHKKAEVLLRLRERPERTLAVMQIGITLVAALAGAVGGAGAEEQLSPVLERLGLNENTADTVAIGLVVVPLTYLTVVIGELVPKTLALKHSLAFALTIAPWVSFFDRLLGPLVTVFEWSTRALLSLFRFATGSQSGMRSEDSQQGTVELGLLSSQHRQYVMNLVDLERKRVRDIFLPWKHVVTVDVRLSAHEVETRLLASGHTRLPVLDGENLVGILNAKEFFALHASGAEHWPSLVRPAVQLQDGLPLLSGLRILQDQRVHMGIVYSSQTRLGMVTLEDILEEVVGEIYDEDDDGALKAILTSSPKTTGYGSEFSLGSVRQK